MVQQGTSSRSSDDVGGSLFLSFPTLQGEPDDYEQILASIELDIQKRQTRLSEIRLRERRTTLKVTLYTLGFWVVYVSLWYAQFLPGFNRQRPDAAFEKFVKGVPVLIGPILYVTLLWSVNPRLR